MKSEINSNTVNFEANEEDFAERIKKANGKNSFTELTALIETSKSNYNQSDSIVENLSLWLTENHPIYDGKGFNDALEFRSYLLYSFSFFPENKRVLDYLISELTLSDNQNIICSAIFTGRKYPDNRIIPLIEKFTSDDYNIKVNFSDFQFNSNYNYKTTIQEEAVKTLNALKLQQKEPVSHKASCCSSKIGTEKESFSKLTEKKERRNKDLNIAFLDQNNDSFKLKNTKKPFIVTFFYTSCTNPKKCASTISKLAELQKNLSGKKNKFGIYAITYDEYVDKAEVLKKYGDSYNFMFDSNNKFLLPLNTEEKEKMDVQFNTTVNYGNGTVNQHGIQLFLFDKAGKLASIIKNENWTVLSVSDKINSLLKE
ncbi:SCO family protein [Flavobacterium sp.]|uniref:SCO family protein n=1 Tax=Flavobacterium sp. TaxID=239 RepID=UPI003D6BC80D